MSKRAAVIHCLRHSPAHGILGKLFNLPELVSSIKPKHSQAIWRGKWIDKCKSPGSSWAHNTYRCSPPPPQSLPHPCSCSRHPCFSHPPAFSISLNMILSSPLQIPKIMPVLTNLPFQCLPPPCPAPFCPSILRLYSCLSPQYANATGKLELLYISVSPT